MLGTTDANGFLGVTSRTGTNVTKGGGGPFAFGFANVFPGQTLYLQAHAVDAGSTLPLQIANSDGRSLAIPNAATTKVVQCTRLFHTDGVPGGPWSSFTGPPSLSSRAEPVTIGYAVVTEFTY
jgi:hypothetical protein